VNKMEIKENPMRKIKIEKVTLNIGCGTDANKLERGKKLLEILTGRNPLITKSKRRSTFGVAKGKPIGVMVTLRKKEAVEFLKKALQGVENKLKLSQFNSEGNFSFGIYRHTRNKILTRCWFDGVRSFCQFGKTGLQN